MNLTHLHLLINHLPVIGAFLGGIVLLFALSSRSRSTFYAAYTVYIISALGALVAYSTGESAEETIEEMAGIAKPAIEAHEASAVFALVGFVVLGLLAIAGILVSHYRQRLQFRWGIIVLVLSLMTFVTIARTAWLGGKIRHTEISNEQRSIPAQNEEAE